MRGLSGGRVKVAGLLVSATLVSATAGLLSAQGVLAQLGLTEAVARRLLFDQVRGVGIGNRRSEIAVVGHRAFYKMPRAARGPAASALFAWAKAYVNSPAFKAEYDEFRKGVLPTTGQAPAGDSLDAAVKAQIDEMLANVEQAKAMAASLPPADRPRFLETIKAQEAQVRDPQFAARLRAALEMERGDRARSDEASQRESNVRYPADPQRLFARHLRAFLDDTADADFSARTISLTGGADGIEFVDPGPRQKPVMWQLAVIAGPEATTAARAAAEAWLKEIER